MLSLQEAFKQSLPFPKSMEVWLMCVKKHFWKHCRLRREEYNMSHRIVCWRNVICVLIVTINNTCLCKLLPIWSAIMVPYFGYGSCTTSSCAVETHFGILKNTIFRNELPARLDHFVTKHARYNQGNILVNFETETDHVGHIESIHAEKEIKSETQELR